MHPVRKTIPHGVFDIPNQTTVVYVTVCTSKRVPWLATEYHHELLRETWLNATGWLVGSYIIMPDHIHFYATKGDMDCTVEKWSKYWKRNFALLHKNSDWKFMTDHFDYRIRDHAQFTEKWLYMQNNPVRKGLVTNADDWPFKGIIHEWVWMNR